jgi:hypothetical protein
LENCNFENDCHCLDGTDIVTNQKITNSGGWQAWKTSTTKGIHLPAGEHVLPVLLNSGGYNLNYILVRPHVESSLDGEIVNRIELFPNPAADKIYVTIGGGCFVTGTSLKLSPAEGLQMISRFLIERRNLSKLPGFREIVTVIAK